MTILVKNLRNTRQDPRRRSHRRSDRTTARRGKIMVGARCVKDGGKGITISEQTLLTNIVQIHRLFVAGVVSLRALPRSTEMEHKAARLIQDGDAGAIKAFYDAVAESVNQLGAAGGTDSPDVPPIDLLEKLATVDSVADVDATLEAAFVAAETETEATPEPVEAAVPADEEPEPTRAKPKRRAPAPRRRANKPKS